MHRGRTHSVADRVSQLWQQMTTHVRHRLREASVPGALTRTALFLVVLELLLVAGMLTFPVATQSNESGLLAGSALNLAAALIAGALLLRWLDQRPVGALGLALTRATARELGLGLVIGTVSIGLAAGLLAIAGDLHYTRQAGSAAAWLGANAQAFGLLAVAAFAEEALFRGYAFQTVGRAAGPLTATLLGSTVFAAAHAHNPHASVLALGNIFIAGVLLSIAYVRTRSLWFAGGLHLGWNWGMASLLDLPVSGLAILNTPLYEPAVNGRAWFTGGAFGPEGGIAATIAFGFSIIVVLTLPAVREAAGMRALRPLLDRET